jgi:hypothetical protein
MALKWYAYESLNISDFYSYPYFFFIFSSRLIYLSLFNSCVSPFFSASINLISVAIVKNAKEQWITI